MIKIICGGRNCGKTYENALEELEKQKFVNRHLLARILALESENARLKADKEEMARRDLQIAEEADRLNQKYEVECVKFKTLMLNVKKAREEIKDASFTHHFDIGEYVGELVEARHIVNLCDVLRIIDKLIESEG